MTLSQIAIVSALTALVCGPASWLWGYRASLWDEPRTLQIQIQWPQADLTDADDKVRQAAQTMGELKK